MDRESLELEAVSHETFADMATEYYEDVRRQLDNRLGNMALMAVNETETGINNRGFLAKIIGELPRLQDDNSLHLESQADFRWAQNTVLWTNREPYYVIGRDICAPQATLLLHRPLPAGTKRVKGIPSLMIAQMRAKRWERMSTATKDNLYIPLNSREVNRYYDSSKGVYTIKHYDSDNQGFMTGHYSYLTGVFGLIDKCVLSAPHMNVIEDLSQSVGYTTLQRFEAFAHISHLSAAYNKTAEVGSAIERQIIQGDQLALFN
jgi:hypothetical protein